METELFRIKGVVTQWNDAKRFGILLDLFNRKFLAFPDDIPRDSVGRRYLKEGERVLFSPDQKEDARAEPESRNQTPVRARKIFFLSRPLYEHLPADYQEFVSVETWHGNWGIARRPLGGRLYLAREEIISQGVEDIEPGKVLWTKVAPPKRFSGKAPRENDHWRAVEIEVCGYDPQGQLVRYPAKTTNRKQSGFLTLATALEKFAEAS